MVNWMIDTRRLFGRIAGPALVGYLLFLTSPRPEHFDRYIDERKKYEPEFCMRLEHPECRVTFSRGILFSTAMIESCGFRSQHVTPFGASTGLSRWTYYGFLNNFWFERKQF